MASNYNLSNSTEVIAHESTNLKLLFDIYTPRPHLIIRRKTDIPEAECENQIEAFLEAANKTEIIEAFELCMDFLNRNPDFKNFNAIFSLHTGYFCSSNIFHAHLSVNLELYKNLFELKTGSSKDWNSYLAKVDQHPKKETIRFQNYKKKDLDTIKSLTADRAAINDLQHINGLEIVMHSSLPKIGFKTSEDVPSGYFKVLLAMKDYADKRGYFEKEKGGSHLCIYLENVTEKESFKATGYILVTGSDYYQLYPSDAGAKEWKTQYEKSKYYVET